MLETTNAFDRLPLEMYVTTVMDRTRTIVGGVRSDFWTEQRLDRVRNRWLALRQAPEQVAQDMAEEHHILAEIAPEPQKQEPVYGPQTKAYEQTMGFLNRTKHLRPWEKR